AQTLAPQATKFGKSVLATDFAPQA
ncbi:hypothetical protein A2U01_0104056, partial [Trifolium medium]|nr:hypothetical protein [Trifolium medium]